MVLSALEWLSLRAEQSLLKPFDYSQNLSLYHLDDAPEQRPWLASSNHTVLADYNFT